MPPRLGLNFPWLRQTRDFSWYCLDRFVPEGMSQVSRRSEVGNHKWRSLNTRLSSGTSAGTFAVSAGPCENYHAEAGTKNEPWQVVGTSSKKGLENRSSRGLLHFPWGLTENARRSRYEKRTEQIFCTRSKKRVRKSIITFRTQDLIDFVFEGFRSTLKRFYESSRKS